MIDMPVAIDTNVFLSILYKEMDYQKCVDVIKKFEVNDRIISVITLTEMVSSIYTRSEEKYTEGIALLERVVVENNIINVTKEIANLAGKLKSKYNFSLADSVILTTALILNCDAIITKDPEFEKVEEIKIIKI